MKHPQCDNMLIAAYDEEATFECTGDVARIEEVLKYPHWNWVYFESKPKTVTKRLYANKQGDVWFIERPIEGYTIPINGTDTEVECE